MKISLVNILMLGSGAILVYSGIKAYNPKDVILWALGGKEPESFLPKSIPVDETIPGQRTPGGTWEDKQPDNSKPASTTTGTDGPDRVWA